VAVRWYSTVVDATDPTRLASFWAQALGWSIFRHRAPDQSDDRARRRDDSGWTIMVAGPAHELLARREQL
jgi:Glyoxalase-like domain